MGASCPHLKLDSSTAIRLGWRAVNFAAQILLARDNFGCGSSREHAPWALQDYGFKVILAPSFADIFFNNCFKIGLLPIVQEGKIIDQLFHEVNETELMRVDMLHQMTGKRHLHALVRQGPGKFLNIMHDVHTWQLAYVHTNPSRLRIATAPDVKEYPAILLYQLFNAVRHAHVILSREGPGICRVDVLIRGTA